MIGKEGDLGIQSTLDRLQKLAEAQAERDKQRLEHIAQAFEILRSEVVSSALLGRVGNATAVIYEQESAHSFLDRRTVLARNKKHLPDGPQRLDLQGMNESK